MGFIIPTAKDLYDQYLSQIQSALNTTVPAGKKAFVKVLASIFATFGVSVYKYANDSIKQLLVLTADLEGLTLIGREFGISIKPATNAIFTVSISSYDGAEIGIDKEFIGDINQLSYYPQYTAISTGLTVSVILISQATGATNNMEIGDTLTLASPISGVGTTATVTSVTDVAIDVEDTEAYRSRLLYAKRNRGGGGNAYDYKKWAEEVIGVKQAIPISGLPFVDESAEDFLDGDCEAVGVADWIVAPGRPWSMRIKNTSIFMEGLQSLQLYTGGGTTDSMVYQECLTVGQGYKICGFIKKTNGNSTSDFAIGVGDHNDDMSWQYVYLKTSVDFSSSGWYYVEAYFVATGIDLCFWEDTAIPNHVDGVCIDNFILSPSEPLERTVFVEAVSDIDPDGVAPEYLLNQVRESINTDPLSGVTRPPMGHIDSLLYVRSIYRTEIMVAIEALIIDPASRADCIDQIEADLDKYLRSLNYYNAAVDSEEDRRDQISAASISSVIYKILVNYGASVSGVSFGLIRVLPGIPLPALVAYFLKPGETCKLGELYA